jgi:hypothetical protein
MSSVNRFVVLFVFSSSLMVSVACLSQSALPSPPNAGSPHAAKPDLGLPTATEPPSCPWPSPQATYVGPMGPDTGAPPFFSSEVNVNSEAIVTVGNNYYNIWLGAPGDHPNQGLIRVLVLSADPCASRRLGTAMPSMMTDYLTPKGPLTATKVEGSILFYSIEGGGSGRFNFVTRQFVP